MAQKPTLKKSQPLTAAIIADMNPGEERGDAQSAGLRVRCLASGQKVFFYRYRARDGALREIRLDEVGPLNLLYIRENHLRRYLGKTRQMFVWCNWGERGWADKAELHCYPIPERSAIFQSHVHIHRRFHEYELLK